MTTTRSNASSARHHNNSKHGVLSDRTNSAERAKAADTTRQFVFVQQWKAFPAAAAGNIAPRSQYNQLTTHDGPTEVNRYTDINYRPPTATRYTESVEHDPTIKLLDVCEGMECRQTVLVTTATE